MQPLAHFALAASILICALGAIILCLLVFRYGLASPGAEPTDATLRRLYVTRVGHLAGAVCFAVAAGLTVVALTLQSRAATPPAPVPRPGVAAEPARGLARADARHAELVQRLRVLDERARVTEGRLDDLRAAQARTAAKLADVERTATVKIDALERTSRRRAATTAAPEPHPNRPSARTVSSSTAAPAALSTSGRTSEAIAPPPRGVPAVTDVAPAKRDDGTRVDPVTPRDERRPEGAFADPPSVQPAGTENDIFTRAERAIVASGGHTVTRQLERLAKGFEHVVAQVGRTLRSIAE